MSDSSTQPASSAAVLPDVPTMESPVKPHWPAQLAQLATGILYSLISQQRTLGPGYILLIVLIFMAAAIYVTRITHHKQLSLMLTHITSAIITIALVISVAFLIASLPTHTATAGTLLIDAVLLWITNVMVFAVWYWQIDGGGPWQRPSDTHIPRDFMFPQFSAGIANWAPGFVDYLFLAFNTSTAFSPTDTAVLSKRAKALVILQSSLSLVVLAVLAARAINIF